jgi:hypothetical protein
MQLHGAEPRLVRAVRMGFEWLCEGTNSFESGRTSDLWIILRSSTRVWWTSIWVCAVTVSLTDIIGSVEGEVPKISDRNAGFYGGIYSLIQLENINIPEALEMAQAVFKLLFLVTS